MTKAVYNRRGHKKNFYIVLLAALFLFGQTVSAFPAPPPPRGGGPGHGGGPGPIHHGGPPSHGHSGPSPGAVIGTAIGAIAIGAAVGAAMNSAAPAPAPAPPPTPVPVQATVPVAVVNQPYTTTTTLSPIAYGKVFSVLPVGYTALMASGQLYYYYAGTYYKLTPSGYVVVSPPPGAVIASLPAGCATVRVNGTPYFSYAGAYYRRVANGYEVTPNPTGTISGKIIVTSKTLNVRSGPGKDNSVITTVFSGNILQIIGNAPGWYYVRLPDNTAGWIMAKFTSRIAQPADG